MNCDSWEIYNLYLKSIFLKFNIDNGGISTYTPSIIFTSHVRSTRKGNVFGRICPSVHRGKGVGYILPRSSPGREGAGGLGLSRTCPEGRECDVHILSGQVLSMSRSCQVEGLFPLTRSGLEGKGKGYPIKVTFPLPPARHDRGIVVGIAS